MIRKVDIESVGEAMKAAAHEAVLPRFGMLKAQEWTLKAGDELVTIADREAEAKLSRSLKLLAPGSCVVGEEACAADPDLLGKLGGDMVWVVDPIDGTANFAAGRRPFAIMVALLRRGKLVASWILDPMTMRLATAEQGGGAWLNGERVHSGQHSPQVGELRGIISDAFLPVEMQVVIEPVRKAVAEVVPSLRCAGHEYPLVATGGRDFAIYWRTLVWDHAPGALFLREAGGAVVHLDGSMYEPSKPRSGLLLATTSEIASVLLSLLDPA